MKHKNLSVLILIACFLNLVKVSGQVISDVKGRPLKQIEYFEIDGNPFFLKSWAKGDVKLTDGKIITDVNLKYDQVKDALIFKGKDGEEFYFTDIVKEFNLNNGITNSVFRSGFGQYKDFPANSYYEIIQSGKLTILKKTSKTIIETKEYNSATTVRKVTSSLNYYFAKNDSIIASTRENIKIIANTIDPQKSNDLLEFIEKNKLSFKKEEDLKKFTTYFNALP